MMGNNPVRAEMEEKEAVNEEGNVEVGRDVEGPDVEDDPQEPVERMDDQELDDGDAGTAQIEIIEEQQIRLADFAMRPRL
ncbi:unnamed protein product [Bursaphelenchus xylophilus]|uniref:(pine wood nematode) hypothetical protein n=1 Tax=Bursaphelenchus xylophilus TaxID=6326 RepID=A0A1I7SV11_BURXY|nr:unnamed protein product [Bursaphelenchus xylophilus]CAG9100716.1 unnamed protein product [Bursaphelenchus xylophilus]